jgi:hypothetical protein
MTDKAKRMIELAKQSREIMTKIKQYTLLLQQVNEQLETLKLITDFKTYQQNIKRKTNKHLPNVQTTLPNRKRQESTPRPTKQR